MLTITKCETVIRHVRKKIADGIWLQGGKLPPEQMIQSELGVSRTAIREAMSVLSSEGLIVRRQRAGTFVAKDTGEQLIAILAPMQVLSSYEEGYFYQSIVTDAQKLIRQAGFRPVLAVGSGPTDEKFCESIHLFDEPVSRNITGVISMGENIALREKIESAGKYFVCIEVVDSPGPGYVNLSYEHMIKMGVEHLKGHGHCDFALMYPDVPASETEMKEESVARRRNLEKWVGECGIELRKDRYLTVPFDNGRAQAYEIFKAMWATPDRPKAIFFTDDVICDITMRAIMELGIQIPRDLSVITQSLSGRELPYPASLTTLQFSTSEIVNSAWYTLRNMIKNNQRDQTFVQIYPKIVKGDSVSFA